MRKALLAVAGAALTGTILVGPAYSEVGHTFGDRAIADFSEAIRLGPKNAQAFNQRCYALAIIGQAQQALADCDEYGRAEVDRERWQTGQ